MEKVANRLYELRKKHALSQEELADKLGVTRQAVSKWERGESLPDTDNLINLAKLYQTSLDDLVGFSNQANENQNSYNKESSKEANQENSDIFDGDNAKDRKYIKISDGNIDIIGAQKRVRIDHNGISIDDEERKAVIINNAKNSAMQWTSVVALLALVVYLLLGGIWSLWHPAWILFVGIPVVSGTISAIKYRNTYHFPYPVLCATIYLILGFTLNLWHPAWVIFITIPLYYGIISQIKKTKNR